MRCQRLLRSVLASSVGWAMAAALAYAQDAAPPPACPAPAQVSEPPADGGPTAAPRRRWLPGSGMVRFVKNQNWIGCRSDRFTLGCGNLKTELSFVFSSCRTFYGEPCWKGPPPPGAPGYGYGPMPAPAQAGCRCP